MAEMLASTSPPQGGGNGQEGEMRRPLMVSAIAALGVVYGDIGTSPLYAFKQCFVGGHGVSPTPENILGVLSLIVWSLIFVVSIKYLLFILRADNRGEGGIIALVALLNPWHSAPWSRRRILMLMGLFGAALLYGDGTITPAISVLSAIEGLGIATPAFHPYLVPITVVILVGLFLFQSRGASKIGAVFGPIMLAWFLVLGLLGLFNVFRAPQVLAAFDPVYAIAFLAAQKMLGFTILGTVFLAVTGAETLYADMGHFGRQPIRLAWFTVALPALLLNYFGQGALVLSDPIMVAHPFYGLAPHWAIYPMVILATVATIIASQAVISGAFSLTRQAVQLGQLPRMNIIQTDREQIGQVYIPAVNWLLMVATIALVMGFRSSSNLASAYGLAVSCDMVITTILAVFVAIRWGWHPVFAIALGALFLVVDFAFLGANMFKFLDGGWYPVMIAGLVFGIMAVWRGGAKRLEAETHERSEPLMDFVQRQSMGPQIRIRGTAVFMTAETADTPPLLLRHLDHNQILHERVVLMTVYTEDRPRVASADRLKIDDLGMGFFRVVARYGFLQTPNVPVALRLCEKFGLDIDPDTATFYIGHEEVIAAKSSRGMALIRAHLFAFLQRNAARNVVYFNIPSDRVVTLGSHVRM